MHDTDRHIHEFLLELVVWAIAVEIRQAKEEIMSELDDAVTRISTDINNAVDALNALKAEIAALGNSGADTTALNVAAQKLEDALGNAGANAGQIPAPVEAPPADAPVVTE